jgi:hypothetical protein
MTLVHEARHAVQDEPAIGLKGAGKRKRENDAFTLETNFLLSFRDPIIMQYAIPVHYWQNFVQAKVSGEFEINPAAIAAYVNAHYDDDEQPAPPPGAPQPRPQRRYMTVGQWEKLNPGMKAVLPHDADLGPQDRMVELGKVDFLSKESWKVTPDRRSSSAG